MPVFYSWIDLRQKLGLPFLRQTVAISPNKLLFTDLPPVYWYTELVDAINGRGSVARAEIISH